LTIYKTIHKIQDIALDNTNLITYGGSYSVYYNGIIALTLVETREMVAVTSKAVDEQG
jgi:hypothetical protein